MARIPSWWLAVGADNAERLEELFVQVMQDLPMSQAQLAGRIGVDQSTVARWARGRTTPPPGVMLQAVREVRDYLKPQFERASVASNAFQHLLSLAEDEQAKGMQAGQEEVEAIKDLLESLEE